MRRKFLKRREAFDQLSVIEQWKYVAKHFVYGMETENGDRYFVFLNDSDTLEKKVLFKMKKPAYEDLEQLVFMALRLNRFSFYSQERIYSIFKEQIAQQNETIKT